MKALCAELKKSRHRHNALVAVGISLAALLWVLSTGGEAKASVKSAYRVSCHRPETR